VRIDRDRHGAESATFVCRHLAASLCSREPVGFVAAQTSAQPRPDAWCSACETKRLELGGEWCEESEAFAGITLLCAACYDEVRSLNE